MEQIFAKIGIWACFRICRLLMNIIFVHKGNTNLFWTCFSNVSSFSWWSSFLKLPVTSPLPEHIELTAMH